MLMKTTMIILLRWIVGIFLMLLSIGAFVLDDIIPAIIVLIIGFFLIPPIGNLIFGLPQESFHLPRFKINSPFHLPKFKINLPFNTNKFIRQLDFKNDDNLVNTIDVRLNSEKRVFSEKRLRKMGRSIYKETLKSAIDAPFSQKGISRLSQLEEYFHLSVNEISGIKKKFHQKAISTIEKLLKQSYAREYFNSHIQSYIEELAGYFKISSSEINELRNKILTQILQELLSLILLGGRITPQDETVIVHEVKRLGLRKEQLKNLLPSKMMQEIRHKKWLWQLENGILYPIESGKLMMQKTEECYLSFRSKLLETETVNNGYSMGGGGISFPITKDINFGLGTGMAKPITKTIQNSYSGDLFLLNTCILFVTTRKKSFRINFPDLLSFKLYSDAVEFILNRDNHIVQLSGNQAELFAAAMTGALRNYFDKENEVAVAAKKEIAENESIF